MALEYSPTSCSDINGTFRANEKQGQEQITGASSTAGIESIMNGDKHSSVNGNNNRQIDGTTGESQTMPEQDFHAMNLEDKSNSQTEDSKESQNCHPHHHKSSDHTSSPKHVSDSSSETEVSSSDTASSNMSHCTSNSNEAEAEASQSGVTNSSNETDIVKDNVDSVIETGEEETDQNDDCLEDIIIPVPVLPKTSPCSDVKSKPSNGHNQRFGQQKKRPPLARRPTPVKIDPPAKLLNERMKMAKRENSFLEEEEEG